MEVLGTAGPCKLGETPGQPRILGDPRQNSDEKTQGKKGLSTCFPGSTSTGFHTLTQTDQPPLRGL